MKMSTNNANEYLARAAWLLRDHVAIADITGLGNWIAENSSSPDEDEAGDGSAIASAIVDGLESLSGDECYSPKEATEAECMGTAKSATIAIGGTTGPKPIGKAIGRIGGKRL